jgi:hypothetical protein
MPLFRCHFHFDAIDAMRLLMIIDAAIISLRHITRH